jgi:Mg-chelatase subunit ChlD
MSRHANRPVPAHVRRWRLALGRYSQNRLGDLAGIDARMDLSLDYLYGREYAKRGVRASGPGSLDPTQVTALNWLGEARRLFPKSVFETVQGHALDRYALGEILNDPKTLAALEPNRDALRVLLSLKGRLAPAAGDAVRVVVRAVVDDIVRRLKPRVLQAFSGTPNRFRRSNFRSMANFDWRATIRENLKRYDPERRVLALERLRFFSRMKRNLPSTVVLCVDQSGSMVDSVIHSAVMASILAGLPSLRVHLVLFDTSVVDLSDRVDDPVEVLLAAQLGGGTDIGRAVRYCEGLVSAPTRTLFVLVSDFFEGAPVAPLVAAVRRLAEAQVKLLGLVALVDDGEPYYDRELANRLAACGMSIAALTPDRFADWVSGAIA